MRNPIVNLRLSAFIAILVAFCACAPAAFGAAEGTFERSLKVTGPVMLDVETGSGNIEVHSGGAGSVHVTGHIKATHWWGGGNEEDKVRKIQANPPVQQSGNDIRVGHIDDPELRRNVSVSYEITVPADAQVRGHTGSGNAWVEGIRGPLDVESGSGGLKVANIGSSVRAEAGSGNIVVEQVRGNVRAKTGSGSIDAKGVGGGFEGNSGSGNVSLEQTAPGAVRAETGSGSLELRGVRGSLEATSGSGSIHADGDPTGSWVVHTGSGGVELQLASNSSFDLDAQTSSGSISVSQPVVVQGSLGKKHITGKVNGGGVSVNVETGSGSIEVR